MAIWIFLGSLALSFVSSLVLVRNLDKLGAKLGISESLLGLITALGADSPEIASAVFALLAGRRDIGVGVVLGSNILNLAALLGLSAVVAGRVSISRRGLSMNGGVAFLVTAIGGVLIFGLLGPLWSIVLLAFVLLPYTVLSALNAGQIRRLALPPPVCAFLAGAAEQSRNESRSAEQAPKASTTDILSLIPALFSIVLASRGLVNSALSLGHDWGIPDRIIGLLILASLTSIPNILAAVRLARQQRGSAVVSEAFNSNSLNLLAGVCLPALLMGLTAISRTTILAAWYLLGMTLITVVLGLLGRGLNRYTGGLIIGIYAVFVGLVIFSG